MSNPTHSSSCRSWTYPVSCRACSNEVFVHQCTCGSAVLFDELGPPWPRHDCFTKAVNALKAKVLPVLKAGADPRSATFTPFADLKDLLGPALADGRGDGSPIPPASKPSGPGGRPSAKQPVETKKMGPIAGDIQHFIGIVREMSPKTKMLDQLYAEVGSIGLKAFGLPARRNAVQVTIVDTAGEPYESYTCIADKSRLDRAVKVDVMVGATLRSVATPSLSFWLADELQPL